MINVIIIVIKMELLNLIKKDGRVRRIFGKKEIEIIEKQLLGIKLKPSENTRLSRDIRKKFEIIKILAENSSEFELKKGQNIREKIDNAKEAILESKYFSKIKKIILFGSTAENERTFRSDIDIAVEFSEVDKKEATEFRVKTLGKVSDMVDIQVYNVLPEKIRKEIDKKGKVIYERENK